MFLFALLAAIGLVSGVAVVWGIVLLVAALGAWEFDYFRRVLDGAERVHKRETMVRRHRGRVLAVMLVGALLALATVVIDISFGFGLALLLAVVSLAGISRAVHFLRR